MTLHILKTDFRDTQHVNTMTPLFEAHPAIQRWHVDLEDCDRILKVETASNLKESEIVQLLLRYGIHCEALPD